MKYLYLFGAILITYLSIDSITNDLPKGIKLLEFATSSVFWCIFVHYQNEKNV